MPSLRRVDLVINLANLRQAVGVKRINQLMGSQGAVVHEQM